VQVAILQVADSLAAILGVTAGPLTSEKLQSILLGQDSTHSNLSLFKFLATNPDSLKPGQAQSAMAKLHALWQTLVPSELWARFVASSEVIIIPDGSLHLLPFEALAVENNSTKNEARYWLDAGPVIRYAPSATTLYNLTKRIKASTKREPSILSLADPIFDPKQVAEAQTQPDVAPAFASADTVSTVQRALEWEQVVSVYRDNFERTGALGRLPATAQEGQALRKAFGNARVFSLTGLHATELELRQALPGKRFIHLATHGVVDQQRSSAFAALALTPPPTATKEAENDGFLQLCEIYDLKLPECELAVLSACQTNYGRYFEGEGVFALSRGFLAAGAQRVVASQWSVKDVSSYRLMEAFFRQLAAAEKKGQRIDYALALREAKAKVRRQKLYASPYHWAAFVLAGVR
jgi:CHAT domain-containing protein